MCVFEIYFQMVWSNGCIKKLLVHEYPHPLCIVFIRGDISIPKHRKTPVIPGWHNSWPDTRFATHGYVRLSRLPGSTKEQPRPYDLLH